MLPLNSLQSMGDWRLEIGERDFAENSFVFDHSSSVSGWSFAVKAVPDSLAKVVPAYAQPKRAWPIGLLTSGSTSCARE